MKIGDKVKVTRGEYAGKVGIIRNVLPVATPINITYDKLVKTKHKKYFRCLAEDRTMFFGWEDDLEIIE